jgi:hypothetical protein
VHGGGHNAEEIKHHVKQGVHEALSEQAKRVKEAHAPRTGGEH